MPVAAVKNDFQNTSVSLPKLRKTENTGLAIHLHKTVRWNLSDPTTILINGLVVNGYQNRTGMVPERPFAVEDIVISYDVGQDAAIAVGHSS